MLVNFADKIVVGLAGGPIMDELKITPQQFGDLGSSSFYLFSASAIIVGFIVNRVPTRWVLLVMGLVWALAQFPMVGTVGLTTLFMCRIILGAGEGPAFSVAQALSPNSRSPTFSELATTPGMTSIVLTVALTTPHAGMPMFMLTAEQEKTSSRISSAAPWVHLSRGDGRKHAKPSATRSRSTRTPGMISSPHCSSVASKVTRSRSFSRCSVGTMRESSTTHGKR
jgi:hypothetical protein